MIIKATIDDLKLLTAMGRQTFIESHGHSAKKEDIDSYVNEKYTEDVFREELNNKKNIYHILYHEEQPAGFSKIILNTPHPDIPLQNVTKLERIYLLKDFYALKLGSKLFNFNVELSKANEQAGIWLFVWKENERALKFYLKNKFKIVGSYDFQITATHANPNHIMFLEY